MIPQANSYLFWLKNTQKYLVDFFDIIEENLLKILVN